MTAETQNQRPLNVLFLCTGNSARSIIAEAVLNTIGKGKFKAYSAGSMPNGQINPYVAEFLEMEGFDLSNFSSKSWDVFAEGKSQVDFDFVITVCDNAAGEVCPMWPGQPITAHWGMPDPAAQETPEATRKVVRDVFHALSRRLGILTCLPFDRLSRLALEKETRDLAHLKSEPSAE